MHIHLATFNRFAQILSLSLEESEGPVIGVVHIDFERDQVDADIRVGGFSAIELITFVLRKLDEAALDTDELVYWDAAKRIAHSYREV